MTSARVFISHSSEDTAYAIKIKETLEREDIEVWTYEKDLPFSGPIADRVREEISQCDHLFVVLSPAAGRSSWVAWELGHALHLWKSRGERHPSIIGVVSQAGLEATTIQPLAYLTQQPLGPPYSFSAVRNHDLRSPEEVVQLAGQLKPRLTFISRTDGREGDLLRESFKCYEMLFPDAGERDEPSDIETWLTEARIHAGATPWRETYAVMHMGEFVIGMAFFSTHVRRHWSFGNYLGVRRAWRSNNLSRMESFLGQMERRLAEIDPLTKGTVMEVEPVDFKVLELAVSRGRIGGHPDTPIVLSNLRQLRRLNLFQMCGTWAVLGAQGEALPYWQPAMDEEISAGNERQLVLMVRLFSHTRPEDVSLGELVDFVYGDLYGDAYGDAGAVAIPWYREYVRSVRRRVESAAAGGWSLGKLSFRASLRKLLRLAREEEVVRELDL
jgi:hypothetical protein